MHGIDILFVLLGANFVGFGLFVTPLTGLLAAPLGMYFARTSTDEFGQKYFVKLDQLTFRNMLTKAYLFLFLGFLSGALAVIFGVVETMLSVGFSVSLVFMGFAANLTVKRLDYLNKSWEKTFLILLPVIGHLYMIWLAYRASDNP